MKNVKNQPKYKIGEVVKIIGNKTISVGEVVAVADDDPRWIHSGKRTYIYAIDMSGGRNNIKNKLFKLLRINMFEENIKFICEKCGEKSKRLKRIVDKDPIAGWICWECLKKEREEESARKELIEWKRREKLQKECKHEWYILRESYGLNDYCDILKCPKCGKKIHP